MKLYIIAGEASGDLHASHLVKAIKKKDSSVQLRGWGGDKMEQAGIELVKHYRETAFMGFITVLKNLKDIKRLFSFCKKDILDYQPDAIILVDYPGFNLQIAKFAAKNGIKAFYFIAPKIWASRSKRVETIKKCIEKVYSILPFEIDFYHNNNYQAIEYVGNPLIQEVEGFQFDDKKFREENNLSEKSIIALLPGSRKQEIERMLPMMLKACEPYQNDYEVVVGGAPAMEKSFYDDVVGNDKCKIIFDQTYPLLHASYTALITSGTVALEAALLGTPQMVCYKVTGGKLAGYIARNFIIKVRFVSLVNLIVNKVVVQELLQEHCTNHTISAELHRLMKNKAYRKNMLAEYKEVEQAIGNKHGAEIVAKDILTRLK